MNQELVNKINIFMSKVYDSENFVLALKDEFTEEEMLEIFEFCETSGSYLVSIFVNKVKNSKYKFDTDIAFNKIMNALNDLDNFNYRLVFSLCNNLSEEHAYQIIKKIGTINSDVANFHSLIYEIIQGVGSDEFSSKIVIDRLITSSELKDINDNIVRKMKDETIKALCLKYLDSYERAYVVSGFDSDYLKEKYLTFLGRDKGTIIDSFEDDSYRERNLKKYWFLLDPYYKGRIIARFKNKDLIYKYARKLSSDSAKEQVIKMVFETYPDLCFELIDTINNQYYLAGAIGNMGCSDSLIKYAERIRKSDCIFDMLNNCTAKSSVEILKRISLCSDKDIREYWSNRRGDIELFLVLPYIKNFELIEELVDHCEDFVDYEDCFEPLISRYADEYEVDKSHLLYMANMFGLKVLKTLKNKNIIDILNLDNENFEKIFLIFSDKNTILNDVSFNASVNALLQRKFRIKVPEIVLIFPTALHAIETGDIKELGEMIDLLTEVLSEEVVFSDKYLDKVSFINELVKKDDSAIEHLHTLTSKYIKLKRNEYVQSEFNVTKKMSMESQVDTKRAIRTFINNYPLGFIMHFLEYDENKARFYDLNEDEINLLKDKQRLINIINYRKNPIENKELLSLVQKDFKLFESLCEKVLNDYILENTSIEFNIPSKYTYRAVNKENVLAMLMELDVEKIEKSLFSNQELFDNMLNQLEKYGLIGWLDYFDSLLSESGIFLDAGVIASFINYYSVISEELKKRLDAGSISSITFTSYLDFAACFDSDSKRYSLLFKPENYYLIASNPKDNSSSSTKAQRIEAALKYLKVIRQRSKVSIPPLNKEYEIENNKKINVSVGNFSDPINLTFGERTGACMRVLGAGYSLFKFCLEDDNGFHIQFTDPDTGEFVSRVSGFRNGNTVFLNQLRFSKSAKYSNVNIVEACKLIATEIIDSTKDSSTPVENVFISGDYSMKSSKLKPIKLGVSDIKKGLNTTNFWSDVNVNNAILLASANPEKGVLPIKLGSEYNRDRYDVMRIKPTMYVGMDGLEKMLHIELLDQYLSGVEIGDLIISEHNDILFCYVGEDWYIKVNSDNTIDTYIMSNSVNTKAAENEINQVRNIIESRINSFNVNTMKV